MTTLETTSVSEAVVIAAEMARVYKQHVEFYRREYGLSAADADAKASELVIGCPPEVQRKVKEGPAKDLSWFDFNILAEHDQKAAVSRWLEIKEEASHELETGNTAYETVKAFIQGNANPWARARFAAIRKALMASWAPVNGVESILIDTMAQAQTIYCYWLEALGNYTVLDTIQSKPNKSGRDEWQPPRVSTVEALEHAANMSDRFNRLFLRTLRQLRDLRRYNTPLTIQNAQQVNVGGQQVNMVATAPEKPLESQVIDAHPQAEE